MAPDALSVLTIVNVRQQAHHVVLAIDGRATEISWDKARAVGCALLRTAAMAGEYAERGAVLIAASELQVASDIGVAQQGHMVLLRINGVVTEIPWDKAKLLGRALLRVGSMAEEYEKHAQIAFDQAVLLRAGVPVGLTNNPDIQKEAIVEATSNRQLRTQMPGGIKSEEVLGVPTVRTEPPGGGTR
jgi:hypothetical protein